MDRRIQKTRDAIKDAYFNYVIEKKLNKLNISELARRANIDRKTFYLHYSSIEDVVEDFSGDRVEEYLGIISAAEGDNSHMSLQFLFIALNGFVERDLALYREFARDDKRYSFFWDKVEDVIVGAILDNYSEKVDITRADLEVYSRFFVAGVLNIYKRWLKEEYDRELTDLALLVAQMTSNGIRDIMR